MNDDVLRQMDENTARLGAIEDALSAVLIALKLNDRPEIIERFDMFIACRQAAAAAGPHTPSQLAAHRSVFQEVREHLFPKNIE